MIRVDLLGAKEILAAFKGLPYAFTDGIVQKANVRAAVPLVHRMHRLAPVGETGDLAESIGTVKAGKNNKGELGAVETGARRKGGYKGFIAPIVHDGTKPRRTSTGANRGRMPANPFIENAFHQTIGEVQERQAQELATVTGNYLRRVLR